MNNKGKIIKRLLKENGIYYPYIYNIIINKNTDQLGMRLITYGDKLIWGNTCTPLTLKKFWEGVTLINGFLDESLVWRHTEQGDAFWRNENEKMVLGKNNDIIEAVKAHIINKI